MARGPLRFLHASDLHLEEPVRGLAEVPDHLRAALADCAYRAAFRLIQGAIDQQVDFVVLAGDVLAPQETGLRGPLFLVEQFERLSQHQIPVYWGGGSVDPPESWPEGIRLPENVHRFSGGGSETTYFVREGAARVRVVGRPWREGARGAWYDLVSDPQGLPTIAVAYDPSFSDAHVQGFGATIDYWALGGRHQRYSLTTSNGMAHDPGMPQGRHPRDTEPHGCSLVEFDTTGKVRTTALSTETLRWQVERVVLQPHTTRDQFEQDVRSRIAGWRNASGDVPTLVTWNVAGHGRLAGELRHGTWGSEFLARLRQDYGLKSPVVWSVAFESELPQEWGGRWQQEDSLLGEYLRQLRTYDVGEVEPLELGRLLTERQRAGLYSGLLRWTDVGQRQRVLRRAAALGMDLLGGEES